ncbi:MULTISPECIES: hypothetical protein [Leptolyngbya]|nr:hypothetical protein [Leptolyngbya sp. FACHB-1624]MBD1857223.1 hypothetical protein [Leptolyngbya sp. FACHB-1624]
MWKTPGFGVVLRPRNPGERSGDAILMNGQLLGSFLVTIAADECPN